MVCNDLIRFAAVRIIYKYAKTQEVLGINISHTGVGWSGGLTKNLEVKFFSAQISILWVHVAWYCCVLCYYTFN